MKPGTSYAKDAEVTSPPAWGRGLKLTVTGYRWAGCCRPPRGGVD